MVKIRLTRTGKKGEAHYRIIAINAREKRESRAIEFLGYYNPRTNPSTYELNKERIKYWLSVGAQPTYTVSRLLDKEGLYKAVKKKFTKKAGRKKQEREKSDEAEKGKKEEKKAEIKKEEVKEEEIEKKEEVKAEATGKEESQEKIEESTPEEKPEPKKEDKAEK